MMNGRIRLAGVLVALIAVPCWAHCGSCGQGKKAAKTGHGHDHAHGDDHGHGDHHAEVGHPAPDFTLPGVDGKDYKLSDLKGKVVVLEWTNHNCPFVKRHQGKKKTMQKTFAKYSGKPVAWLAIDSTNSCAEQKDGIKGWIKEQKIDYPILLDPAGKVGRLFAAKTTPHVFVIDQKGVLAYSGAIDDDKYGDKEVTRNYAEEAVDALLKGSTVTVASTKSYGCSVKYKK